MKLIKSTTTKDIYVKGAMTLELSKSFSLNDLEKLGQIEEKLHKEFKKEEVPFSKKIKNAIFKFLEI